MRRSLTLLALVVGALSCGPSGTDVDGGSDGDGGGGGGADARAPDAALAGGCTLTLTGAVTGTIPCAASALKTLTDDFTLTGAISTQASGNVAMAAFTLSVPGEIAVRDYAAADLKSGAATLTTVDNKTYAAASGMGAAQGTIGQLRVTGLDPQAGGDTATKVWIPHGSFTATLVGTTAVGMVTLSASF